MLWGWPGSLGARGQRLLSAWEWVEMVEAGPSLRGGAGTLSPPLGGWAGPSLSLCVAAARARPDIRAPGPRTARAQLASGLRAVTSGQCTVGQQADTAVCSDNCRLQAVIMTVMRWQRRVMRMECVNTCHGVCTAAWDWHHQRQDTVCCWNVNNGLYCIFPFNQCTLDIQVNPASDVLIWPGFSEWGGGIETRVTRANKILQQWNF